MSGNTKGRPAMATPRNSYLDVADDSIITEVADKLRRLHWSGYVTRAELEDALDLETPAGCWECPGEFGSNGYRAHCGRDAA